MPRGREHNFDDFVAMCLAGTVVVLRDPEQDARIHFNLQTKARLLQFIGNNGLERVVFVNCREWEKCPIRGRMVDGYQFYAGEKAGYIAFTFCKTSSKWFLKSFHPEPSPKEFRNLPFAGLERLLKP